MILSKMLKKIFTFNFWKYNKNAYDEYRKYDEEFNASFRGDGWKLSRYSKRVYSIENEAISLYRKYQVNKGNIWGYYYQLKLEKFAKKTGIDFLGNVSIGKGLIIGHWGKIVVNGDAKFGNQIMLTHNVTIGRDIRGKREGAPTFGIRVCIRTNSTIVGKINIGDDVLIAPNTFVNFDVPSHSVVIGNPASIHHKDNATEGHLGRFQND